MFGQRTGYEKESQRVHIGFESGKATIEVIGPQIVNVFAPLHTEGHESRAVEQPNAAFEVCDVQVEERADHLEISTSELTVKVYDHFYVDFYDKAGAPLCLDYRGSRDPFLRRGNVSIAEGEGHEAMRTSGRHKIEILKKMDGGEKFYGLGDKTGPLNKRGYEYEMWNTDDPSPHVESHKALYKSIPFFITLQEASAFGIFFDNPFKTFFDLGKENSDYYYFGADDGNLDYYFIYGPDMKSVVSRYTGLTGRTPLPQLWTLGMHQSRWSYAPEARVLEVAKLFREHDVPLDAIHLDIDYMDGYRVFTWDGERFPDPKAMTDKLAEQGIKIVTIIDPGVKKDKGYGIFDEGLEKGYYATDRDGVTYVNTVWPGDSVYPDFSDEPVRRWWAGNQKIMTDDGVAGIWNDMNEPASFTGPLPDDVRFKNDGRETDHREIHNVYGHLMSRATFDGIKEATGKRPFVITRAAYAGTQKYSTVWTGDNQSFWEHLRLSIPMLLNLGLSGFAFAGCDVGGFSHDCTPELLVRWVQAGAFSPLFRNHTAIGTRDQEPWAFDETTLDAYRKAVKLRYKLLPYLYDLMREAEQTGLAPLRPLVLEFPDDPAAREVNDQFLLGSRILVAPVVEQGKTHRAVYLPQGTWIDYNSGESVEGGRTVLAEAPLDVCPIYVRAGSILPGYPDQKYVGERRIDELLLEVYPGEGGYTHTQDDGESYGYRDGAYNEYRFVQTGGRESVLELRLEKGHAGYGEAYRSFRVTVRGFAAASAKIGGEAVEFETENGNTVLRVPAEAGMLKLEA
ncbi:glycoside hydrolase family 31 protein [Saccharibacillus sp. CPCC 101409]|uniref:glycoside hydrolase family 31 protein n=1 Tax=Saccharibacillus sp. CPCC 101409 TaxID=3058041 RepID=UPI0026710864|nr:glycoside hydrolase family 31 protein [Saccharibacillus sp. CPCC 101409]MDO3408602.1 glycoside hydrolase family 31 protein [Saccharibacillus sp. CPCC 101409]